VDACNGIYAAVGCRFFFDFSATYVGVGMICPYLVNASVLLGGVVSWGIMWPLIEQKKGDWYPANLKPSSLRGIVGYRVWIVFFLHCRFAVQVA